VYVIRDFIGLSQQNFEDHEDLIPTTVLAAITTWRISDTRELTTLMFLCRRLKASTDF